MPRQDNRKYTAGDWNVICDVCGQKRKKSETAMSYGTGDIAIFVACLDGCVDYRHPLNSPPPIIWDGYPVPDARPDVLASNATYAGTVIVGNFSSPDTRTSPYRWGTSFPGGIWGETNPDESDFNLDLLQLWGDFY